jgi:predicted GNAT superfamily acetyltransferase
MASSENTSPEPKLRFRLCRTHEEFRACHAIERIVWNDPGLEVPLTLYVVAAETGGQVLGAFAGDRMLGFTLAFAALRGPRVYLHSHLTAVRPEAQNRGVGRGLKLTQRAEAITRAIDLVEWTFDPLEIRNAYLNLMRLGAVVRRYLPNCYGTTTSPLHGGLPTDRLVAEWELRSERVERCLRDEPPIVGYSARAERVAVPKSIAAVKQSNPADARHIQNRIREEFLHWFGLGYAAVAIEISEDAAQYVLEPGIGAAPA